jgi:hypothetical protein
MRKITGAIEWMDRTTSLGEGSRPRARVTERARRADILSPEDETHVGEGLVRRAHVQWGAQAPPPRQKAAERKGVGGR